MDSGKMDSCELGSGEEPTRTTAPDRTMRPKLLLSAALAALIVAAPTGDRISALAMNLGSSSGSSRFTGPVRLNNGPRVSTGNVSSTVIGNGRAVGVVGRGDTGQGPGNPCKPSRKT